MGPQVKGAEVLSSTVEDYVKQLYQLEQKGPGLVGTGRLAAALGVTPGTATAMVKTLAEAGLVEHEPRRGVRLTDEGARHALLVVRRHRLIEQFLVQVLGLDWSEVHDEAERLEHAVSDLVLEKMDELLGRPRMDPHGDPIPDSSGAIARRTLHRLDECAAGDSVRVARIGDQDPQFLRFAEQSGLRPGARLVLERRDPMADSVTLRLEGAAPIVLGMSVARRILVSDG